MKRSDAPDDEASDIVLAESRFLQLVQRGKWYFARRPNASAVVCIAALTERGLLLVEQYRPALRANTIELPAGLAGDIAGQEKEPLVDAAKRELLEETGYVAQEWQELLAMPSSSGLTSECVTMFLAKRLTRQHAGGGDATEDITIHEIPVASVREWLFEQNTAGKFVDARVFAGLYFLTSAS